MQRFLLFVLGSWLVTSTSVANADWSLNLGYQNPSTSTYGVNFLYMGSQWAFETGIGWFDVSANADDDEGEEGEDDDDNASVAVAGDIDVKYLFSKGGVTPFLQLGLGVGAGGKVGDNGGASLGAGGPFAGIGVIAGSKSIYLYVSINASSSSNTFLQAGLGFDI